MSADESENSFKVSACAHTLFNTAQRSSDVQLDEPEGRPGGAEELGGVRGLP